jgi:hypothetical protein
MVIEFHQLTRLLAGSHASAISETYGKVTCQPQMLKLQTIRKNKKGFMAATLSCNKQ